MYASPEFYQHTFDHEVSANHDMLKMLSGVQADKRSTPEFQRAVNLASHMINVRANFLEFLKGSKNVELPWFEDSADYNTLQPRFESMETGWKQYLSRLTDTQIDGRFEFEDNGETWWQTTESQLIQLIGHAAYHRGQVVLLIDQLGGETFDTDYIGWFTQNHPDGWGQV